MKVRLISKTTGIEGTEYEGKSLDQITVGIARLSSSREINELFDEPHKLLRHCISEGHWSVFTTTNLGIEIVTSRAVGRQLLRHWSLRPQELSQRYAEITSFEEVELRQQSKNNRQSSVNVVLDTDSFAPNEYVQRHLKETDEIYKELLKQGISRETARQILPECTTTKIIFNGTLREWITTLNQRLHHTTQKENRLVCEAIRDCFMSECPIISKCLFNFEDAYEIHLLDRLVLEKFGVYKLVKSNGYKKL